MITDEWSNHERQEQNVQDSELQVGVRGSADEGEMVGLDLLLGQSVR